MAAPVLTANEQLLDALVRHQVYLQRYSGAVRNRILRLLDQSEEEIAARIHRRLENAQGGLRSPAELRRLETLLAGIRRIRFESWEKARLEWIEQGSALALAEPRMVAGIVATVAPVELELALPPARTLRAIATARPFQGRVLGEWAKHAAAEDVRRISDAVRVGMVTGDSTQAIVRKVIGTSALKGRDGVTQIARNQAEAITRTAINHIANSARAEFLIENRDVFDEEIYVATLDARTTPICRSLDGKRFEVGTGPQPPVHFSCRSTRVAAIAEDIVTERPARNFTQRQLLEEFAQREGIEIPKTRYALGRGLKGKFDTFARRRMRELTGTVPSKTTYAEWLSRQAASVQDDILGKTRGKLFRRGGLTLDRFVSRAGDEIPLRDLAKRHEEAFRAAGLEPARFE